MNILFANILLVSLLSLCAAFVVISVYCFLYIFLLERTKSYSNASQSNSGESTCLPPSTFYTLLSIHSPMPLFFLDVAFVCFMSLFCALPGGKLYGKMYYFFC